MEVPETLSKGGHKEFLFVSGPSGDAIRYRCKHQAEELEFAGHSADVAHREAIDLAAAAQHYDYVVLYRVPWDDGVAALLRSARSRGTRVLSDVDDLVFQPDRLSMIGGWSHLDGRARETFARSVVGLQRTLTESAGVLVSTDSLRRHAARVNPNVAVSYNAVSEQMVAAAAAVRAGVSQRAAAPVTFAYLSGTHTHDNDFKEAAAALLWLLDRHPQARVLVVGFLDLDVRFARFGGRVSRLGYRSWKRLPALIAREVDVNLAPLERGSEFTDSKSCLKYLEAGLLALPTIATPTADFARVITHGVNGMLAESEDDWRSSLASLLEPERRRELGAAAFHDVLEHHTTRARASAAGAALQSVLGAAPESRALHPR
jgi:glycosyltransferase involved in cell wall biosynthesis